MTYYNQLKRIFDKHVKYYKEDCQRIDKDTLSDIRLPFIWSCRETGTNMFIFDPEMTALEYDTAKAFTIGANHTFFYGNNGNVSPISKERAASMMGNHRLTIAP